MGSWGVLEVVSTTTWGVDGDHIIHGIIYTKSSQIQCSRCGNVGVAIGDRHKDRWSYAEPLFRAGVDEGRV